MTEEQKRFKITKKESYENQISQEKKKATYKTFLVGLSSAAAIVSYLALTKDIDTTERLALKAGSLFTTGSTVYYMKGVIEAISKKTMLEGKIEDINTELEMPENLENRGMKR